MYHVYLSFCDGNDYWEYLDNYSSTHLRNSALQMLPEKARDACSSCHSPYSRSTKIMKIDRSDVATGNFISKRRRRILACVNCCIGSLSASKK